MSTPLSNSETDVRTSTSTSTRLGSERRLEPKTTSLSFSTQPICLVGRGVRSDLSTCKLEPAFFE